jgi:hypothetical protein
VDFYADNYRCNPVPGAPSQEVDCVQNFSSGRCPARQTDPIDSATIASAITTEEPYNILAKWTSINTQCAAQNYGRWKRSNGASGMSKSEYDAFTSKVSAIRRVQDAHPKGPSKASKYYGSTLGTTNNQYSECPPGMVFGSADCNEKVGLCYDECMDGYEPVWYCSNGAATCSYDLRVFACRALCPNPNEGLGPWSPVDSPPLYTCKYDYPRNIVPSDPNLWVQCPDDGRYSILNSSPTDVSVTFSQAARKEPLCVRNTYLRQVTCPIGFIQTADSQNAATKCIKACNEGDTIITLPSGRVVCQQSPADNKRHDMDFVAVADSDQTKQQFQHRVLKRKNFTRGTGSDPNEGLQDPQTPPEGSTTTIVKIALIVLGVFAAFLLFKFITGRRSVPQPPNLQ